MFHFPHGREIAKIHLQNLLISFCRTAANPFSHLFFQGDVGGPKRFEYMYQHNVFATLFPSARAFELGSRILANFSNCRYFYRPQTKSREGYVFTPVYQSFCSQGRGYVYPSMHWLGVCITTCNGAGQMSASRSGGCLLLGWGCLPLGLGGIHTQAEIPWADTPWADIH